jgi:tetratricopeptide (TPR) repeat protein
LTLLLLTTCTTPSPTPPAPAFSARLEVGTRLAAAGERTAAEQAYREAASLAPSDPAPYLPLAYLYLDWNRPQEGLEALSAAEERGANGAQVARLRAALHALQGGWEQVLDNGMVVLEAEPGAHATRHRVAHAYVALGRVEQGIAAYERLLQAIPNDPLAHERLGALLVLSDPEAARPHLRAADTPLAADLLAALDALAGEVVAYRLARVGQTAVRHEAFYLARLALEQAVSDTPGYAEAQALLGHTLDELGQEEEARLHMEAAATLDPGSVLARTLLGIHYLEAGELPAARRYLESAYDLDPRNPALSLQLAQLYAGLGDYAAAEIWLEEALRLAPEDPGVWEAVIRFYLARGLDLEEQRGLEQALTFLLMEPESAVAHELVGWAYYLSGHYREAEYYLKEAVTRSPQLISAYYHLGQLYAEQGRTGAARAIFIEALDRNTDPALRARIEKELEALTG